jgi:hypothetical protein
MASVRAAAKHIAAKVKAALWKVITTDQVRPFVWVYYIALWIWGVYGTFFAAPATYVLPVMGQLVYDAWVWLQIIATSIVMCGLIIEDTAKSIRLIRHGIHLQTGGHGCMFFVLLGYEVSAIRVTAWGEGTYSIFVISPYVVGCLLLTLQGIVKIVAAEQIEA